MKKTITQIQINRIKQLYQKLTLRLNRQLSQGGIKPSMRNKLLAKINKLKNRLARLESSVKIGSVAAAALLTFHSKETMAQVSPQGSEFKVNTYTTSAQSRPATAMDGSGNFVVAWISNGQDSDNSGGIYAQRYNASGTALGGEFIACTNFAGVQTNPDVAMDNAGNFVIVWESTDGSDQGIYVQRFNNSGVAQGSELLVNTYTTGNQSAPSVAMDYDGDFIITWHSDAQDGDGYGIYAQRYNTSGTAQGSELMVNTFTTNSQSYPSIAADLDGDFVIAWESYLQDGSSYGCYAQRFNALGTKQGSEFRVNTYTTNYQNKVSAAIDDAGDFVIAWTSQAQDGSDYGIYAQRYNASGVAEGSEFKVNTYTTNYQTTPNAAMDSDGDFVITWQSYGQSGDTDFGIYGQRYNASGAAQGAEFIINTYTTNDQTKSAVAMDNVGDFIVTWTSSNQDGDNSGVYAQYYKQDLSAVALKTTQGLPLMLYPIPAQNTVFADLENGASVTIMDMQGNIQKQTTLVNKSINLEGLLPGMYMAEITQHGAKAVLKLSVE